MYSFRVRRVLIVSAAISAFVVVASVCVGQEPDRRGEIRLDAPQYKGVKANAPIPPNLHIRNEGGSNGAGLCVIASAVINGNYQGVPSIAGHPNQKGEEGKGSVLWQTAKKRPGGYSPDKLERLLKEVMPDEKWVSYYGRSPEVLDELSAKGYPIGATMNTGAQYHYMPIAHMVSLVHFKKDQLACVVDNNDPGKYHWMPADEFLKRWYSMGSGWAFAWTRLPPVAPVIVAATMIFAVVALLLVSAATALVGGAGVLLLPGPDPE